MELKRWLLGQGHVRGVFTQAEHAEKMAYFVADMRSKGVESALLPSADVVVRACLDAIPVGLDRVAMLDDRRDLRQRVPPGKSNGQCCPMAPGQRPG
ncbi:hypothetical protein [Acrocarpospora pleiomorpha]|uniref:hypothetical protein n=1 Tax=Acrocarpospora pleiomorpha TaxID=90975 RepID=UPI0012D2CCC6|nr:hypothetical protein [Acrocarpospora pleiomorpha]